jgi:hypothetical protein
MLQALLDCGVTSAANPKSYQAAEYLRDARAMSLEEAGKT